MIKIYHNPRCSKSRQCLAIIEEHRKDIEVIKYLDTPLSEKNISEIITLLKISPIDLVRKNEKIWKQQFNNKEYTNQELINILYKNPILIERPIVINGNKAIIGRPPEKVINLL